MLTFTNVRFKGVPLDSSVPGSAPLSPVSLPGANNSIAGCSGSTNNDCCVSFLMGQDPRPSSQSPEVSPVAGGGGIASSSSCSVGDAAPTAHRMTNHSVDTFLDPSPAKSSAASPAALVVGGSCFDRSPSLGIRGDPLRVQSAMAMILPAAFTFAPSYLHPGVLFGLQQPFQRKMNSSPDDPPSPPPPLPPGFEVGATPQELDTLEITTKVKETLQFHNLGQKLFGEVAKYSRTSLYRI